MIIKNQREKPLATTTKVSGRRGGEAISMESKLENQHLATAKELRPEAAGGPFQNLVQNLQLYEGAAECSVLLKIRSPIQVVNYGQRWFGKAGA